jgi:Tol biopolymer transport system component
LKHLTVTGNAVPLVQDVAANPATGGGQFDFSKTGTFLYAAGKTSAQTWQVSWLDSSGKLQPIFAAPGIYGVPRLSPDGKKLAYIDKGTDIYVYDLERQTTTRLTFAGHATIPVWAHDGKHLLFESTANGYSLYWIRSDGSGTAQMLMQSPNGLIPWDFSPNGTVLAYWVLNPDSGFDIWSVSLDLSDSDRPKMATPQLFLGTPADENEARFSSDGRWIVYRSNESGRNEIYVRPFPAAGDAQWQISTGGGLYGLWSTNGRELFYETTDERIMVVDYTVEGNSFVPGKPRLWTDKQIFFPGTSNLDLAPDGKRFVVFTMPEAPADQKTSVHVTMLENFFDEVKRRIP